MRRSLILSLLFGVTLTIGFCLAIWIRSLIYQPRPPVWGIPLNVFSFPGLLASALVFPCKNQDIQIGCEWYRTLPMFVAVNSFACAAISLPLVHLFCSLRRRK
jgi:hypothetical protein